MIIDDGMFKNLMNRAYDGGYTNDLNIADSSAERDFFSSYYWNEQAEEKERLIDKVFSGRDIAIHHVKLPENFVVFIGNGGGLMPTHKQYEIHRALLAEFNEQRFMVAENTYNVKREDSFDFIFPASIEFNELSNGTTLSKTIFENIVTDFMLVGDTGMFGIYADSNWCDKVLYCIHKDYQNSIKNKFRRGLDYYEDIYRRSFGSLEEAISHMTRRVPPQLRSKVVIV